MNDALTREDIKKMQDELDTLRAEMPAILEEVKRTRAFGDLSENFEYKEAKRAKNRNESRIRYLERMVKTAKLVEAAPESTGIGLFDKVEIFIEEDEETESIQLVTSMRQNAMEGRITRNSPVGKAIWGKSVGDRVLVTTDSGYSYYVKILKVEKGEDDAEMPILPY